MTMKQMLAKIDKLAVKWNIDFQNMRGFMEDINKLKVKTQTKRGKSNG